MTNLSYYKSNPSLLILFSWAINLILFHSGSLKDTDCTLHHFFIKCHNSSLTEAQAASSNSVFLRLGQLSSIHTFITVNSTAAKARRSLVHVTTDALSGSLYSSREAEYCQQLTALLGNIVIWTATFHWERIPHFMTLCIKSSLELYCGN